MILIGQIQQIDQEIFKEAIDREINSLSIKVSYKEIPAKFQCNICNNIFYYDELNLEDDQKENIHFIPEAIYIFVKCPKCGTNDFKILQGRGVFVEFP